MNSEPSSKSSYNTLQPFLLSLMMILGIFLGIKINDKQGSDSWIDKFDDNESTIGRVEEVLRFIENKYVDSVDREVLMDKAMSAIVGQLDPHSLYISPKELKGVRRQMAGNFYGIGIETQAIDDTFYVAHVLKDSPASRSGIKLGDRILAIDDSIVAGQKLTYQDLSSLMADNDEIRLKLSEYQTGNQKTEVITPEEININSAEYHFFIDSSTAYIELSRFTSKSYTDFMKALETHVRDHKLPNLIIDLRNNPGGYLPEANKILSQLFTEQDLLMLYTQGISGDKQEFKTTGKNFFEIENIVVLVDEGSASGSEILAGAIQDWDRGVVIGRRSFGKGLVQEQYPLTNGGALRLTVARYYIPSGRSIQRPFNDKDKYYNELYNREKEGQYFTDSYIPDSLNVFETKKLKRKVFGGGGVSPDIFVASNPRYHEDKYHHLTQTLSNFVFRGYLNNEYKFAEEAIISRSCNPKSIVSDFYQTLNEKSKAEFDRYKDILEEDVLGLLARYNGGLLMQKKVMSDFDAMILEAKKTLKKEDLFAELQ